MKKIAKAILVIGGTLGYLFGVALLMEKYYMFLYGKGAVFYTGNQFFTIQVLAFLIFSGFMAFFWSKDGLMDLSYDSEDGIKSEQEPCKKAVWTVAAVIVLLFVNLFFVHWYDRITPDGVELHRFFSTETYVWDDVEYYTLDTHVMDDTLSMKVVMKDGRKVELLPAVLSTESDGFDAHFKEGVYDFLPWLNERFIEKNKPLKIKQEKKLLRKLQKYAAWEELAQELIEPCRLAGTYQ